MYRSLQDQKLTQKLEEHDPGMTKKSLHRTT